MTISHEELSKNIEELEIVAEKINLMSKVIYNAIDHEIQENLTDIVYLTYPYEIMLNDIKDLLDKIDCIGVNVVNDDCTQRHLSLWGGKYS